MTSRVFAPSAERIVAAGSAEREDVLREIICLGTAALLAKGLELTAVNLARLDDGTLFQNDSVYARQGIEVTRRAHVGDDAGPAAGDVCETCDQFSGVLIARAATNTLLRREW